MDADAGACVWGHCVGDDDRRRGVHGGLAIGAWLASRSADRRPDLGRWARIELAVAASSALATAAILNLPQVWAAIASALEGDVIVVVFRVIVAAACLAVPTTLMGMTLPLLVATQREQRALPLLYAANTLGAVVGALAVGFVLLAVLGERGSIAFAVALNVAAGVSALRAGALVDPTSTNAMTTVETMANGDTAIPPAKAPWLALVVAFCVGFAMLGLELAWTRLLIFLVGSSTYAFSSMIAMYLAGVAAGGFVASRRAFVSVGAVGVALMTMATLSIASLRVFALLGEQRLALHYNYSPLQEASDVLGFLVVSAAVVLPTTFVSGLVFPWLAALVGGGGRAAGVVYAANTVGSVVGALLVGFGLIAMLGPVGAVFACGVALALVALVVVVVGGRVRSSVVLAAAATVVIAIGVIPEEDLNGSLVARRYAPTGASLVRHVDAVDTSVSVLLPMGEGAMPPSLALNGILTSTVSDASRMMGALPLSLVDAPQNALVICFGVGGTFRVANQHVDAVHAVELSRQVVDAFPLFGGDPAELTARNNRVFVDDGRNHLLGSRERYDAIIVDAAPPMYGAGAINLYSREMMALIAAHLSEAGVFLLWLPTQTWRDDVWSVIRGVTETFGHVQVLAPTGSGIFVLAGHRSFDTSLEPALGRLRQRPRVTDQTRADLTWLLKPGPTVVRLDDAEVRRRALSHPPLTDDNPLTELPLLHLLRNDPLVTRGIDFVN